MSALPRVICIPQPLTDDVNWMRFRFAGNQCRLPIVVMAMLCLTW